MLDFVIRNARVAGRHDTLTDIGFENGRIAAVEPNLVCDAPSHDAEGCLCCGGLIETHIHLDKSRIIDRCAPETERIGECREAREGGQEDLHGRGRSRPRARDAGELHQARRDAHAHACRGRSRRRHARLRGRAGAGRRIQMGDRHRAVRVSAGGPDQQSRHRRAAGRRPEARRQGRSARRRATTPTMPARSGACSNWRANTTSTSTCISTSATRRTISMRTWSAS